MAAILNGGRGCRTWAHDRTILAIVGKLIWFNGYKREDLERDLLSKYA